MTEYFQFNVKIDSASHPELVEFLLKLKSENKLNSVVRESLYMYKDNSKSSKYEQFNLFE